MAEEPIVIFWHRRDLRLNDNSGLYYALKQNDKVLPLFIFDTEILKDLDPEDARVSFIYSQILIIQKELLKFNSSLIIKIGRPIDIFAELLKEHKIKTVYANHDYEPYAIARDSEVDALLSKFKITFKTFKDQVIFEKSEVLALNNTPYKVFTPYKNKWLNTLNDFYLKSYPTDKYFKNFLKISPYAIPSLKEIGFEISEIVVPSKNLIEEQLKLYASTRDFPDKNTTSRLSVHLRFGTISIRTIATMAKDLSEVWLSEFIWREFFMQLLYNFPYVVNEPFNKKFKNFQWRHDEKDFHLWCEGKTGYPFVDAGMRELNATGFMHNRARLVTASFLTKHLLIDWKWGEAYFGKKLLDYELASNNGNWQWSAGTGADAQPFFRIFNPVLQQKKFDPENNYIKKWVPEFGTPSYPLPMIEHTEAVSRAKKAFGLLDKTEGSK